MWKQFSAAETQAKAINQHLNPPSLKRLRSEDTEYQHTCKPIDDQESSLLSDNKIGHYTGVISPSRWFIWIESCNGVFESEVYSQRNETLYIPVRDDVLINLKNIEQISFGSGTYFIGDMQARFTDTARGDIINLWRYSPIKESLYVSRSLLFTNPQEFERIKSKILLL